LGLRFGVGVGVRVMVRREDYGLGDEVKVGKWGDGVWEKERFWLKMVWGGG
jgi:hypothetical protein